MTETPTIEASQPRRLRRRPSGSRWHGGVCAGLAAYTGYDVALFRLAFILLAILGGGGVALYILLWLTIPAVGETQSIARREFADRHARPRRFWALALLAALALVCSAHTLVIAALAVALWLLFADREGGPQAPQAG
jgi:phage shock protein PspC (stress-responsive transcriptional regulator)